MGIFRSTTVSPAVIATTPFRLLLFVADEQTSYKNKNRLSPSERPASDDDVAVIDAGPVAVDASLVELKIFSVIFSVLLLAISYFAVKAIVRTWKRRNADYLLTWAHNNQSKNLCKCLRQQPSTSSLETAPQLTAPVTKIVPDDDEGAATTGPPTTSSGVGTVDSSDASADTSSTNPLLELLSATPTTSSDQSSPVEPSITVAEIALISARVGFGSSSSDAPILRHHRHKRKLHSAVSDGQRRKRSSNSSPPSPVFPRRRPETDDPTTPSGPTAIHSHRHRKSEPFGHQQHRHPRRKAKRRVSLDADLEERVQPPIAAIYGMIPNGDFQSPSPLNSTNGPLPVDCSRMDRERHLPSRMWVDDDDDAGSLSIPLSVATAPPDYFDTMNAEWERQGFCPLYKSHRSRGTVTVPGTP